MSSWIPPPWIRHCNCIYKLLKVKLPCEPVYPSAGRSVIISWKGGKFHFHAPIGAYFLKLFFFYKFSPLFCSGLHYFAFCLILMQTCQKQVYVGIVDKPRLTGVNMMRSLYTLLSSWSSFLKQFTVLIIDKTTKNLIKILWLLSGIYAY